MSELGKIDHIVHLILENRSFDHMLGFLYADAGNKSPAGQDFDGLTGNEWNPDDLGRQIKVFKIQATDAHPYLMPGADPGEGFQNTAYQLYSNDDPAPGSVPDNQGFVLNFKSAIASDLAKHYKDSLPGTQPSDIMGMYTPSCCPSCRAWPGALPSATRGSRRPRR
jgi:phospholipase C